MSLKLSLLLNIRPTLVSQPTSRRDAESKINKPKHLSPREKMSGVATNIYLRKNVRKTKKRSASFENKGLGVVYAWRR